MTRITDRSSRRLGLLLLLAVCAACSSTEEMTLDEYLNRVGQLGSYDKDVARNAAAAIRRSPPEPTKAVLRGILQGELPGNWSQLCCLVENPVDLRKRAEQTVTRTWCEVDRKLRMYFSLAV